MTKHGVPNKELYTKKHPDEDPVWYFRWGDYIAGGFADQRMARGALKHLEDKAAGTFGWETYFSKMLDVIRSKSKDTSSQIGCVIVGPSNEIRSTGYNGFCRGANDDILEVPERYARPAKYKWFEHSERNAIYNAARVGVALEGCRIYVTGMPCMDCARAIIQSGLVEVIYRPMVFGGNWDEHWKEVGGLFQECGVVFRQLHDINQYLITKVLINE
jgi:dCMP deaminase